MLTFNFKLTIIIVKISLSNSATNKNSETETFLFTPLNDNLKENTFCHRRSIIETPFGVPRVTERMAP